MGRARQRGFRALRQGQIALSCVAAMWAALACRGEDGNSGEADAEVRPGAEFALPWKPVGRDLPVYVPEDYTRERTWPVVVFYHGLNGEPSTGFVRGPTGGRGAIVVGMEYLERGLTRRTAAAQAVYQRREWEQLEGMLRTLSRRVRLDTDGVYLAGVSKGGWQVSACAESAKPWVAGYMIVLAGRFPRTRTSSPDLNGIPVYVGTGQKDGNNPYARMAVQYFGRCGALTTWEEYEGRGHDVDPAAPLLRAWVDMVLLLRGEPRRQAARKWAAQALTDARKAADALTGFRILDAMVGDPRFRFCGHQLRDTATDSLKRLSEAVEVRGHARAEELFEKALWAEQSARRLGDLEEALALYQRTAEEYPGTVHGGLAGREAERVAVSVDESRSRLRRSARSVTRPRINIR